MLKIQIILQTGLLVNEKVILKSLELGIKNSENHVRNYKLL